MVKTRLAGAALVLAITTAGAPTSEAAAPSATSARKAPNVRCMQLDVAERKVRRAGFRVRLRGGGIFGIVNKRAWVVVNQRQGKGIVTLTAGRSC